MTAMSRMVTVVVAALGLLTACGGGNPTSAPSSTSVPATVAPTTTNAPTTTVRPPAKTRVATSSTVGTAPLPATGDSFSGEGMTVAQANELQQAVDEGHQPWRTDAKMVAEAFAQGRFGWSGVDSKLTDAHTAEVTNRADGRKVVLQLRQPARVGEGGIWTVVGGVWVK